MGIWGIILILALIIIGLWILMSLFRQRGSIGNQEGKNKTNVNKTTNKKNNVLNAKNGTPKSFKQIQEGEIIEEVEYVDEFDPNVKPTTEELDRIIAEADVDIIGLDNKYQQDGLNFNPQKMNNARRGRTRLTNRRGQFQRGQFQREKFQPGDLAGFGRISNQPSRPSRPSRPSAPNRPYQPDRPERAGRIGDASVAPPSDQPITNVQSNRQSNERDTFISQHNRLRQSKGVQPLSWDSSLAVTAQQWANKLATDSQRMGQASLQHRTGSNLGENIAWSSDQNANVLFASKGWADEEPLYDPNTFQCKAGGYNECGHYTQMIWDKTNKLGCGTARNSKGTFVVCNYTPPGNMTQGKFVNEDGVQKVVQFVCNPVNSSDCRRGSS